MRTWIAASPGLRLLWALTAVLALGIVAELAVPDRPAPAPPVAAGPAGEAAVAADQAGAWMSAILARPVFNPGRRPSSQTAVGSGGGVPRLAGIMILSRRRQAIFAAPDDGAPSIVAAEGSLVGDWTVVAIDAGTVQLAGPGGRRIVRPSYANASMAASLPTDAPPLDPIVQPSGAAIFSNTVALSSGGG